MRPSLSSSQQMFSFARCNANDARGTGRQRAPDGGIGRRSLPHARCRGRDDPVDPAAALRPRLHRDVAHPAGGAEAREHELAPSALLPRSAGVPGGGPPLLPLRLLAPVVVASTIAVFVTGVALLIQGPGRGIVLGLHKASFVVWLVATGVHVLAYLGASHASLSRTGVGGALRRPGIPRPAVAPRGHGHGRRDPRRVDGPVRRAVAALARVRRA